jgi:hypothetical protein
MPAAERHPHDTLAVDVGAARSKAGWRDVVDLGESGGGRVRAGIEPHDRPLSGEHPDRAPHRAVDRARHDRVKAAGDALILLRFDRLVRLNTGVALAVAIGVEHQCRLALRLAASPVSSNTLVSSQPTTGPPPLVHDVSSLSKPNRRLSVSTQVSTRVY